MAHLFLGHPLPASDFRGVEAPADEHAGPFLSLGPCSASGTDGKACTWLGCDGSEAVPRPELLEGHAGGLCPGARWLQGRRGGGLEARAQRSFLTKALVISKIT